MDETKVFENEFKKLPSDKSQMKVKNQLQYETEDKLDNILQKVAKSKSLEKKHRIVNQHIYQEYFYFNPIYRKMVSKVTQVLTREGLDQQRASRFLLTLPNTEMVVKYRKHR